MLKKVGSPSKIAVEGGLMLDPNLAVTRLKEKIKGNTASLDILHEMLKSQGITDYSGADFQKVVELLQSTGITVTK